MQENIQYGVLRNLMLSLNIRVAVFNIKGDLFFGKICLPNHVQIVLYQNVCKLYTLHK